LTKQEPERRELWEWRTGGGACYDKGNEKLQCQKDTCRAPLNYFDLTFRG
jgi:hypothetical protein